MGGVLDVHHDVHKRAELLPLLFAVPFPDIVPGAYEQRYVVLFGKPCAPFRHGSVLTRMVGAFLQIRYPQERRCLSALGVFEVEFANKILKAGPGATVYIDCKPWNSFGWAIRDAMKKRPDVTIKASFLSEGYKGTPLKVTIPAARTDLFDNNGYLGLCRAGTALGYDQ